MDNTRRPGTDNMIFDGYLRDSAEETIEDLIACLFELEPHWDKITSPHVDLGHCALTVHAADEFLRRARGLADGSRAS